MRPRTLDGYSKWIADGGACVSGVDEIMRLCDYEMLFFVLALCACKYIVPMHPCALYTETRDGNT